MAGTMGVRSGGKRAMISAINVTPLVDVVLVLLIILMVSANYIVSRSLKVELPKTETSDGVPDKPNSVVLTKDGRMLWNDVAVDEAKLGAELKALVAKDPELTLVVSADKEVPHGSVVHVLDAAKVAGVSKFAINVQPE
jgi:biopolymer transport protein ExbD